MVTGAKKTGARPRESAAPKKAGGVPARTAPIGAPSRTAPGSAPSRMAPAPASPARKPKADAFSVFNYAFMALLSFLFLYPFWYILILSFNEGTDTVKGGVYFWARKFTLGNYKVVLNGTFTDALAISAARTVIGTAGSILITAMAAFALSRGELLLRKLLTTVFFITMLFGAGLIPYYLQLRNLSLLNNFWVYVIPGLFSVWNMIVMRTSFKTNIPESLVESARIDGAGYSYIFFAIVLPLSMPLLAALSLFTAVGHWNDWFSGAYYVTNLKLHPLQTYLYRMLKTVESTTLASTAMLDAGLQSAQEASLYNPRAITPLSVKMATIMVTAVPILASYPFLQRYFVKGVMIGSIKE